MLKRRIPLYCFQISITAVFLINALNVLAQVPVEAETRLRGIYESNEYSAKYYRATWLEDGSGYTIMETIPGSNERVRVQYDAATGNRLMNQEAGNRPGNTSPDGQLSVDTEQGNLHVRELNSGNTIQLTENAIEGSTSNRNATWSPDSKWIAFVHTDRSGIPFRAMLVPGDPSYPELRENRFARVGGTIATSRVGIVDAQGKEIRWLSISQPAEGYYLEEISWAGNSNDLLVEKHSRGRDKREFLIADIRTGEIESMYSESDPAWVVASHGINSGLEWIRNYSEFIVLSEKDGWRRAYVYSREGEELAILTPGGVDIIEQGILDKEDGLYYYYASPENGTQQYLYRVGLDGKRNAEQVTPADQKGWHDYNFSPDAKWAFHTYSTFDTPPITELVQLPDHQVVRVVEDNKALRDTMNPLISRPTEFFKIEIGNGVVMDAWMLKPSDFDPSKKYPVFVYVYGEPHGQTVLDEWGTSHVNYHRVIADLGYIVVSIDNRGTPAPKGAAWRRSVFPSLGPLSTVEQAAGIKELGKIRSYIDMSRVGIWGWSGGGSNTLNAMFREPDVYNVGIAVAPKPQAHLYNAWFQEIYMGTVEENPEAYRQSSAINYAEGLKGDLLIIHGTGETNTHLEITEGLVDRLIALGKQFDYFTYPNRDHGIRRGEGTELHVRMLMTRYLLEHLPAGGR